MRQFARFKLGPHKTKLETRAKCRRIDTLAFPLSRWMELSKMTPGLSMVTLFLGITKFKIKASTYQKSATALTWSKFDAKVQDIPSVTVTPQIGDAMLFGKILPKSAYEGTSSQEIGSYRIPSVYIEHVTTSQALIRANLAYAKLVKNNEEGGGVNKPASDYYRTPVPFSFMAVGPVALGWNL